DPTSPDRELQDGPTVRERGQQVDGRPEHLRGEHRTVQVVVPCGGLDAPHLTAHHGPDPATALRRGRRDFRDPTASVLLGGPGQPQHLLPCRRTRGETDTSREGAQHWWGGSHCGASLHVSTTSKILSFW